MNKGFPGERPEYKIICSCRKPKPGMLLQAARDFNIGLSKSWMVGDDANDVLAGQTAGCRVAYLGSDRQDVPHYDGLKAFTDAQL